MNKTQYLNFSKNFITLYDSATNVARIYLNRIGYEKPLITDIKFDSTLKFSFKSEGKTYALDYQNLYTDLRVVKEKFKHTDILTLEGYEIV